MLKIKFQKKSSGGGRSLFLRLSCQPGNGELFGRNPTSNSPNVLEAGQDQPPSWRWEQQQRWCWPGWDHPRLDFAFGGVSLCQGGGLESVVLVRPVTTTKLDSNNFSNYLSLASPCVQWVCQRSLQWCHSLQSPGYQTVSVATEGPVSARWSSEHELQTRTAVSCRKE